MFFARFYQREYRFKVVDNVQIISKKAVSIEFGTAFLGNVDKFSVEK